VLAHHVAELLGERRGGERLGHEARSLGERAAADVLVLGAAGEEQDGGVIASPSPSTTLRVVIVSVPPPGIASCAFTARFITTWFSNATVNPRTAPRRPGRA
jgi:hypothetical protein